MENPAHRSGDLDYNHSVIEMSRSLWVHGPQPETVVSHPSEYDTGLHPGVMLEPKRKKQQQQLINMPEFKKSQTFESCF